ncbi:MAG: hypothetical protein ACKVQW_11670 [Pyrinomonadaceae bacterium]
MKLFRKLFLFGLFVGGIFVLDSAAVQGQVLPTKVRSYLKEKYPGYKLDRGDPICKSRAVVSGNFNGDSKRDYAVMFNKGRSPYVIAFLSQGTNYKAHILEGGSASSILYVERKGEKYAEIVGNTDERVTRRLKYDAPGGGSCESATFIWIYHNGRFRQAWTSD